MSSRASLLAIGGTAATCSFAWVGYHSSATQLHTLKVVVTLVLVSDMAQSWAGKAIGGKPCVPRLSPGKTAPGYIAAVLLVTPLGVALGLGIAAAARTVVLGFVGDLYFSAVKRAIGIKDYADTLGAHGGFLDRFDGVLFAMLPYFSLT